MKTVENTNEVQLATKTTESSNNIESPHSIIGAIDTDSAVESFARCISKVYGIDFEPEPDGEIHRLSNPEKSNWNIDLWYALDPSCTYAVYGDWAVGEPWSYWYADGFTELSDEELAKIESRIEIARDKRIDKRAEEHAITAKRAAKLIARAEPADSNHLYIKRKHIDPANAMQIKDMLLIPIQDIEGNLCNAQKISSSGKKRFLEGGKISGNFSLIGCESLPTSGKIVVCEGWATGVTVHNMYGSPVVVAMYAGNLPKVCKALRQKLPDSVTITIAADDDRHNKANPGLTKAIEAADAISVEFIRPDYPCNDCKCSDFNDLAACLRQKKAVNADDPSNELESTSSNVISTAGQPIRLTSALTPVPPFEIDMLPDSFVSFVTDAARRMQIPPDFLAVAVLAVSAGMIGAKYGIYPKQKDNWLIIPTIWAALIGGPSTLKTACMGAAQQPVFEIEKELAAEFLEASEIYKLDTEFSDERLKKVKKDSIELYGQDRQKAINAVQAAAFTDPPPTRQRIIFNDATVEKLGELLSQNPNGLILTRDELSGWLAKMGQEDHQGDRAFFLECYDGLNRFITDRIGRGTIEIERCTLSIVGGIQPTKIAHTIRSAVQGIIDDGLMQRFQFAVWPDVPNKWKWIDRKPDAAAYLRYKSVIRALHELPTPEPEETGKYLRFSMPAQALFIEWTERLQQDIRSDQLHPVMQSHLAKMPKTISGLALLFELVDGGREEVGLRATVRALKWAPYLTAHAHRLYSLSTSQEITGAKLLLTRREKLPDIFTARDVRRKNWAGLTTSQAAVDAIECLVDHNFLTELPVSTTHRGGRSTMRYRWHVLTSDFA